MRKLCNLRTDYLEKEFGKLYSNEIIITEERECHIKNRHPQDYEIFVQYGVDILLNPDFVIKDTLNIGTIFFVKKLEGTSLNVVVRLVLSSDHPDYKNSVMTAYRLRDKNLEKLIKKHNNNILYKKEY